MKYLFGLGNVGKEYVHTPHNAGWLFLDYIYENSLVKRVWESSSIFNCEFAQVEIMSKPYTLVKPLLFMNRSGEVISKYMQKNNISITDILVAHDDLDIVLGKYKIQTGVGPKKHNGIIDIEKRLGTIDFSRIRIGVENRNGVDIPGESYVLMKYTNKELETLNGVFFEIFSYLNK